jgi:RNA polymerase sigma factor (TIGR02999 family)
MSGLVQKYRYGDIGMSGPQTDARVETTSPFVGGSPADGDCGVLWSLVYDELRGVARRQLRGGSDTLQATALVHEAYMRLAEDERVSSRGRAYFFGAAARAMRQILVDHARVRSRAKRGGGETPLTLKTGDAGVDSLTTDLLDLHRALEVLEELNPRQARVVECRYFAGLDVNETAEALAVSPRTVKRDWMLARAWLFRELRAGAEP